MSRPPFCSWSMNDFSPFQDMKIAACRKPEKILVPIAEALRWRGGGGYLYQEKLDGEFAHWTDGQTMIVGERLAGGRFGAFDCIAWQGEDIAAWPTSERMRVLRGWFQDVKNRLAGTLAPPGWSQDAKIFICPEGNGGEFLEAVLARGGEGVVAKELSAPYGRMFAAKRVQTFFCVVTDRDEFRASVTLADAVTGEARGKMPLRSRFDLCRVGSVLKIEAFGLTAKGLLREARPDKDTPSSWLVKF